MSKGKAAPPLPAIYAIRGQKVVLDRDLAKLYGVPVKQLNQAVRRNAARFPDDFSFVVSRAELAALKSQSEASSSDDDGSAAVPNIDTGHGGSRKPPRVFTEHGALMAANVLRSEKAVEMSLYLIRAFVKMRETLQTNATILKRLAEIDRRLIEHDSALREVFERLQPLLDAPEADDATKPKIGFHRGNR